MSRDENVAFTDLELRLLEAVAKQRGISIEEAANQLLSEGLAQRVQHRTGRRPSSNVTQFRRY